MYVPTSIRIDPIYISIDYAYYLAYIIHNDQSFCV